jgi:ATP-dependent DNA helicase PIF1
MNLQNYMRCAMRALFRSAPRARRPLSSDPAAQAPGVRVVAASDCRRSLPASHQTVNSGEHTKPPSHDLLTQILIDEALHTPIVPFAEPSGATRASALQDQSRLVVTPEHEQALSYIRAGRKVVFVTGQAGTGKSTFIRSLKNELGPSVPVLAPTGVAALNVEGQTIHSFFHLPPHIVNPDEIQPLRNRRLFEELKTIIIDEISMVRADLMHAVDISLRKNRGKNSPFGGVQLLVVGDLFQLPPVIASDLESRYIHERYKTPFFLSAPCMQTVKPAIVELTKVFRQQDTHFLALLQNVREGNHLIETITELNRRCLVGQEEDRDSIILTPDNATAGRINHRRLARLPGPEVAYEGIVVGKFNIESERLPAPKDLRLKVDTQVMFTKNDSSHRWVNGTIGRVTALSLTSATVSVGRASYTVPRDVWESFAYRYDEERDRIVREVIGTYTQLPLMPAWAVTIHKSQGKTFDEVQIDIAGGAFAEGQLYVALSRCRTLAGIRLLRPLRLQDVRVNPLVKEFYRGIRRSEHEETAKGPPALCGGAEVAP